MSIKLETIYNYGGGGGGGYKDGGQLIDGDFIKVENNTASSYDNVNRDPINLYFEPKDGEVLDAIVELTTAVNSTVNVYVVKSGLYYLLGNIGGNTVNAGDNYKVTITANSYSVDQVINNNPGSKIIIGNNAYGVAKITGAGLYIMTENLNENIAETARQTAYNGDDSTRSNGYGLLYDPLGIWNNDGTVKSSFSAIIPEGWRIPSIADYKKITDLLEGGSVNKIKSIDGWATPGTNELGTNFLPSGMGLGKPANYWEHRDTVCYLLTNTINGVYMKIFQVQNGLFTLNDEYLYWNDNTAVRRFFAMRFVKDI